MPQDQPFPAKRPRIDLTTLKSEILSELFDSKIISKPLEIMKRVHLNQKEYLEKQQRAMYELEVAIERVERGEAVGRSGVG